MSDYTPSEQEIEAAARAIGEHAYLGDDVVLDAVDLIVFARAALIAAHAVAPEPREDVAELVRLVEYALHICMNGERAPGGDETWAQFGRDAETYLRSRPATPTTKETDR